MRSGRTDRVPALAAAYLQKVRETGDASFYTRADTLLQQALARNPHDQAALVQAATLAGGRHDFRGALALARRADAAVPGTLAPLPIKVDALVELGRYGAAERTLQRLVDLKPNLSAYARVSYFRELTGDLGGAVEAMRRAIDAGGPALENVAYVQSLLGGLELAARAAGRGAACLRRGTGRDARAMRRPPPDVRGSRPLAGDLRGAIRRWRGVVARLPLPEYVIAPRGDRAGGGRDGRGRRRDFALVRAQQRLLARRGRQHRRRARHLRGRPRLAGARRRARALGLAQRAERPLGRRARLDADPRRPSAGGTALGAPGAAARLARPGRSATTRA